jgi:SAM-dependent methyltransferase
MPSIAIGNIASMRRAINPPKKCNCGDKKAVQPVQKVYTDCPVCSFDDPIKEPELKPCPRNWPKRADIAEIHRKALADVVARDICAPDNLSGSGVLLVGEGKYWAGIVIAVKLLREVGCNLPVQVWHNGTIGKDLNDMEGVKLVDARELVKNHPARILRGWEIKTYALLHSGLKEVLYLDADAYCVADPSPLFSLLQDHPFVFWSDFESNKKNVKWEWSGIDGRGMPAVQGGQLLIDLQKFWRETMISHFINMHSDYFYSHQFGDQDSWPIALAATGINYRNLGAAHWQNVAFRCKFEGKDYIVHRCQSKMFIGHKPKRCDLLPKEARVFEMLNDLTPSDPKSVFERVYESHLWAKDDSSGEGSNESQRQPYLKLVNKFVQDNGITSVVDAGCGDGNIIRRIVAEKITAVDVYSPHIERCRKEAPSITWLDFDLDKDRESLPSADLLLMKDVLQHLPNEMVVSLLDYVVASGKWKYVLLTHDRLQTVNDCKIGEFRGLDMSKYPLNRYKLQKVADYLHKSVLQLVCS